MPSIALLSEAPTSSEVPSRPHVSKTVSSFTTQLVQYDTPVPFDTVIARLNVEVNKRGSSDIMGFLSKVTRQSQFVSLIQDEAKNGFLYFTNYPHHRLLTFPDGQPKPRIELYVVGNPLIAQGIMALNAAASYSVPLRLLVLEKADGTGAEVHYHLPSSVLELPLGQQSEQLTAILQSLDAKFEGLVATITAPLPAPKVLN